MLTSSEVRFFDGKGRVVIDYPVKHLDKKIVELLKQSKNTEVDFRFDSSRLFIVNKHDKSSIALLYNVDMLDHRVGWLIVKMCLVSEDFGFIITPMFNWYRYRVFELYNSIMGDFYKALIDLSKIHEGKISLVIDYNYNYHRIVIKK